MNRLRPLSWAILFCCAVLLVWQYTHRNATNRPLEPASSESAAPESRTASTASSNSNREPSLRSATPDDGVAPGATSTPPTTATAPNQTTVGVPETPESSSLPEETVLQNLRTCFRQYASVFGENPVGTNPEITSALQGENPKKMNFLRADGNRVNSNGELVDVWGTPYFFHQLSAHETEIRSAGPDRVMYTGDDLVTR